MNDSNRMLLEKTQERVAMQLRFIESRQNRIDELEGLLREIVLSWEEAGCHDSFCDKFDRIYDRSVIIKKLLEVKK